MSQPEKQMKQTINNSNLRETALTVGSLSIQHINQKWVKIPPSPTYEWVRNDPFLRFHSNTQGWAQSTKNGSGNRHVVTR